MAPILSDLATPVCVRQVAQAVIVGFNATNPGCSGAMSLRQLVKPAVDTALGHVAPTTSAPLTSSAAAGGAAEREQALRLGFDDTSDDLWRELSAALERHLRNGPEPAFSEQAGPEQAGPEQAGSEQAGPEQVGARPFGAASPEWLDGLKGWLAVILEVALCKCKCLGPSRLR